MSNEHWFMLHKPKCPAGPVSLRNGPSLCQGCGAGSRPFVPAEDYASLGEKKAMLHVTLTSVLQSVDDLIASSLGVYGLRLDGNIVMWDELLEGGRLETRLKAIDAARAVLSRGDST